MLSAEKSLGNLLMMRAIIFIISIADTVGFYDANRNNLHTRINVWNNFTSNMSSFFPVQYSKYNAVDGTEMYIREPHVLQRRKTNGANFELDNPSASNNRAFRGREYSDGSLLGEKSLRNRRAKRNVNGAESNTNTDQVPKETSPAEAANEATTSPAGVAVLEESESITVERLLANVSFIENGTAEPSECNKSSSNTSVAEPESGANYTTGHDLDFQTLHGHGTDNEKINAEQKSGNESRAELELSSVENLHLNVSLIENGTAEPTECNKSSNNDSFTAPEAGANFTVDNNFDFQSLASDETDGEMFATQEPEDESHATQEPEDESHATQEPEDESHAEHEPDDESHAEHEPEDESHAEHEPEDESHAEHEPEDESHATQEPEDESHATQEPEDESHAEHEPEDESHAEHEPEDESHAEHEPEDESHAEYEPEDESHAEHEPEDESHAEHEPEDESHAEHEPENESHAEHEPEDESHAEREPEDESHAEHEPEDESHAEHEPEDESHAEHEPEDESHAEYEPEDESHAEYEPEDESHAEHEPEGESYAEHEPEYESEPEGEIWPEPGPDWSTAIKTFCWTWPFHVGLFATLFILVSLAAVFLMGSSVAEKGWKHCSKSIIALSFLILSFSLTRTIFLLTDAYGHSGNVSLLFLRIMFSLGLPGFSASFANLLLIILDTTKTTQSPPRFLKLSFILGMYAVHLAVVVISDILVFTVQGWMKVILFLCQLFFIAYGFSAGVGFFYAARILKRNLKASQNAKDPLENRLRMLRFLSYTSGGVAICVGGVNMYMAVGEMGVFSEVLFVEARKWWWVQTITRALEALACAMVLLAFMNTAKAASVRDLWLRWTNRLLGSQLCPCAVRQRRVGDVETAINGNLKKPIKPDIHTDTTDNGHVHV